MAGFVILFLRVVRNCLTGKGALEQGPEGLERITWIFGKQGPWEQDHAMQRSCLSMLGMFSGTAERGHVPGGG